MGTPESNDVADPVSGDEDETVDDGNFQTSSRHRRYGVDAMGDFVLFEVFHHGAQRGGIITDFIAAKRHGFSDLFSRGSISVAHRSEGAPHNPCLIEVRACRRKMRIIPIGK